MATAQADLRTSAEAAEAAEARPLAWLTFAKRREFAWKTALLAATTVALVPVILSKHALAGQAYLALLALIHVGALAIFAKGVHKRDIAPSAFGLFWRAAGLAVMVALLMMIRLNPESSWFWPSLFGIWAVHTAGLSLLHLRARDGARCPFLPGAWSR